MAAVLALALAMQTVNSLGPRSGPGLALLSVIESASGAGGD